MKKFKSMNFTACKANLFGFILIIMLFLNGCSAYINRPVHTLGAWALLSKMEEHRGVAVTAEKRLVMEAKDNRNTTDQKFVICAEPSPDVAQSILSMFKITADWGKQKRLNSTELESLFNSIPVPLVVRSQGLQFYRDSVFALCQMRMNGWIAENGDGFKSALEQISKDAKDIIIEEVKSGSLHYPVLIEQYKEAIKGMDKTPNLINDETEQQSSAIENSSSQESPDGANPQTDSTTNSTVAPTQ